jgi:hypothetical protein
MTIDQAIQSFISRRRAMGRVIERAKPDFAQ